MSNRNFDHRVIIQRLQNQVYARNLYQNNVNGKGLINNPQTTDGNASRYNTFVPGAQTDYFRGLVGAGETVSLGGTFGISSTPSSTAQSGLQSFSAPASAPVPNIWTQLGDDIDGEAAFDLSGWSVSLSADGSNVAISAVGNDGNGTGTDRGHVRVYKNIGNVWTQLGQDIDGEAMGDQSGWKVSLSADGSTVAIGAIGNDGNDGNGIDFRGHVRVYKNIANVWTQLGQDIDGEATGDQSGWSVSLSADGSTVAIGAMYNDGNGIINRGHVRVYKNIANVWTQLGQDIDGEAMNDQSGYSVSLSADGSTVAIGAIYNDGNGIINRGHVRVYKNISNVWTQLGQDIDGEATGDLSGGSVSLSADGSIVAIGASANDMYRGHVRVYKNISNVWTQLGLDIDGEALSDENGYSVSLSADGSTVAISSPGNDVVRGKVRIYKNISNVWTQQGDDIDGEAAIDYSGWSVSLSADGSTVAIGAIYNNGNINSDNNRGHVRVYKNYALV